MKKFIILLTVCMGLVACQSEPVNPEAQNIARVLQVDSKLLNNTKTLSEMVVKLKAVDLSGCPSEFVNAYKKYIASWEAFSSVEQEMFKTDIDRASKTIDSFLSAYASDSGKATVKLSENWPTYSKEIIAGVSNIAGALNAVKTQALTHNVPYPANKKMIIF